MILFLVCTNLLENIIYIIRNATIGGSTHDLANRYFIMPRHVKRMLQLNYGMMHAVSVGLEQ